MNQFIWIITAPVLFDTKYCDIAYNWSNCYNPIQLLVTEWFVSTFPSYIAIVYSLSLVLYIQQYNISVDIFLISSKTSCNPAVHVQLLFTETFHFKRFALLPDGTFHLQFDSRTAPGQS